MKCLLSYQTQSFNFKILNIKMSIIITITLAGVVAFLIFLHSYLKRKYTYWSVRNVPFLQPVPFLGNCGYFLMQKEYVGFTVQKILQKFPNKPFVGAYIGTEPCLIIQDPNLINLVTTGKYMHFSSRGLMNYIHNETIGRSIIFLHGEEWKFTRLNLNPMFSTTRVRSMFPSVESVARQFEEHLREEVKDSQFEAKQLTKVYTMACIVLVAFGIETNHFKESNDFHKIAEIFFDYRSIRGLKFTFCQIWPSIFYGLGFRAWPTPVTDFFKKVITEVFEARGNKPSGRNDFVDALLSLKQSADAKHSIDDVYLTAQSIAIFISGFDTTAATLSFCLYEIAKHEEVQKKIHKEIDKYLSKTGGVLTYDCLIDLPFLTACMYETLRVYPMIGVVARETTENFTFPCGLEAEKGLRIYLPVYHVHHNPEYFPEPEIFRPERFYGISKQEFKPSTFMPFGEGPRICLGKRFGKMVALCGLVTMLKDHTVILADNMPRKLELAPVSLTTLAKNGVHLKLLPRVK